MKTYSRSKLALVVLVSLSLMATGCSPQWISIALADLPVLAQMALNIGTMATTLQSGKQLTADETSAIQNISNEASKDLNLLQVLYNDYKSNGKAATIQKIQAVIADIDTNLPALLESAHIRDAALFARITAAVNLIVATVNSFASLVPDTGNVSAQKQVNQKVASIPRATEIKRRWNQQVCLIGEKGMAISNCALR